MEQEPAVVEQERRYSGVLAGAVAHVKLSKPIVVEEAASLWCSGEPMFCPRQQI